jgi:hypothetical protein
LARKCSSRRLHRPFRSTGSWKPSTPSVRGGPPARSSSRWIHELLGRAFRADVANSMQNFCNRDSRLLRRDARRRILTGDVKRSLVGVRVGAVYHPAMLLAFADGSRLKQDVSCPTPDRSESRLPVPCHQHRNRSYARRLPDRRMGERGSMIGLSRPRIQGRKGAFGGYLRSDSATIRSGGDKLGIPQKAEFELRMTGLWVKPY